MSRYIRKFDHDEARRRYAAGETITAIARDSGVVWMAVSRVVNPAVADKMAAASKAHYAATCELCGNPCLSHRHTVKAKRGITRDFCNRCAARLRRNPTRPNADGITCVRCWNCHEWKPVTEFPPRVGRRIREGAAIGKTTCRACGTALRQAYRERHKLPCLVCGKPALPPSEKGTNGTDFPRCLACYRARKAAA